MKAALISAGALLVVVALATIITRAAVQRSVARKISITSPNGIDSLEKIRLGGADQWILIRSWDKTKPLLLLIHGGPGFSEMPFAHVNAELEKDFVVVHWDQRGAGKAYPAPDDTLDVEQFVSDARELTVLLLARFNVPKLLLVGHSWGSMIGALTVARAPQKFFAYVGVSQFADAPESERMMYRFALHEAKRTSNAKAMHELRRIGEPPYESMRDFRTMKNWVGKFGERDFRAMGRLRFVRLALASPVYSWRDLVNLGLGARISFEELWREIFYKTNLFRDAPRLDVPVYFLEGRHDRVVTVSAAMAERYFTSLDAPRGKHLIWFDNSGHWPQLEEPKKFQRVLVEQVAGARE